MDIAKLAENLGLEAEDFSELFELYMQTTSTDLEELKAALATGDTEEIHKKAHSIKGASGNLGFDELYNTASEIDDQAREGSLDGLEEKVQNFDHKFEEMVSEFKSLS